jgi:ERCC4-type nuclease
MDILLDPRQGSGELQPGLEDVGFKVTVAQMDAADFVFEGHGPAGPCLIGVERKRLRDALQSMQTGRFSRSQLPSMLATYEYNALVIEGVWKPDPETGQLMTLGKGGWIPVTLGARVFQARDLENWILSLQTQTPLIVKETRDGRHTCQTLRSMAFWWQKKWVDHKSLAGVYQQKPDTLVEMEYTVAQRVAFQVDGIGWEKAAKVAEAFPTVLELAAADYRQLMKVEGVGKALAKRIQESMQTRLVVRKRV